MIEDGQDEQLIQDLDEIGSMQSGSSNDLGLPRPYKCRGHENTTMHFLDILRQSKTLNPGDPV